MVTIVFKVITTIVHTKVYSQGYIVYTEIHWLSLHAIVISRTKECRILIQVKICFAKKSMIIFHI